MFIRLLKYVNRVINKIVNTEDKAEGFPRFLRDAAALGIDINDYLEDHLKWGHSDIIMEKAVFPVLSSMKAPRVLELGAGTGRCSRKLNTKINEIGGGELVLVDHSQWIINFLQNYFKDSPKVTAVLNDGDTLALQMSGNYDLIFSNGTFVEMKLGRFYTYAKSFYQQLRSGGYVIFDFLDSGTSEGWKFMEDTSEKLDCYTYHSLETVSNVFLNFGFEFVDKHQIGESTYVVFRKN